MSPSVELARIISSALLLVTLVVLGARVNRWWCSRWRCLLPAAGTGFIALFVGVANIDALLHDRPGGLGTFTITIATVALLMQALTVGMGRSHERSKDHDAAGAYTAFRPEAGRPCAPSDPRC